MIFLFDNAHLKTIADASEAAYPAEACGLIVGRGKGQLIRVTRVIPAQNIETAPNKFEIDPAARIALEKELRDTGTKDRLVGHYHSHPDGSAEPSKTDREMAFEPELAWVICSVVEGQAVQIVAHRLDEKKNNFRNVPIRIRHVPKPGEAVVAEEDGTDE